MSNKRPLSPHIGIYKPQITSMLSILHRFTGIGLYIGAVLLGWWIIFSTFGCSHCVEPLIGHPIAKIFFALWTLALYYHLLNGMRHLFWDMGKGFELKTLYRSGYAVLFGAITLTALSWFYVLYY